MANRTVTWSPRHFDGSIFTGSVDIAQGPVMLSSGTLTHVRDTKTYKLTSGNLSVSLMPTDLPEHKDVSWGYVFTPHLFDSTGSPVEGAVPFLVKVPSGTTALAIDNQVPNDVADSVNIKYVKGAQGDVGSSADNIISGTIETGTPSVTLTPVTGGKRLDLVVPPTVTATRLSTGIVKLTF